MAHELVLTNTKEWFEAAVPEPTERNIHVQLGVHLEEVREMLLEIYSQDLTTMMLLDATQKNLHGLAERLKKFDGRIAFPNRIATLDAICDQLVTATGVAHMLEMDPVGALDEVNRSNFSKFDEDGKPIFTEQGKVAKSPNYSKPDLKPFV